MTTVQEVLLSEVALTRQRYFLCDDLRVIVDVTCALLDSAGCSLLSSESACIFSKSRRAWAVDISIGISRASSVLQFFSSSSDLLDVAIYSFICQSGLRAHHKVRGDPVFDGASVMLGRMLLTSNSKTQATFEEMTPTRLGNYLCLL